MLVLPDLPYAYDALEPVISRRTLHFHHDKHHAAYVKTTNDLAEKAGASSANLEELVRGAARSQDQTLFNNASQAWNHAFFWSAMTPRRQSLTGELQSAINAAFGDVAGLRKAFVADGAGHFGSGWVWLVADRNSNLRVIATHDARDMLTQTDVTPLLVCDLWEHAYYLDYQNDRKAFLEAWFDALPHWEFAGYQLAAAKSRGEAWRYPQVGATAQAGRAAR
jgi:superoxide dismutase, Fe-Mn family